MQQHPALSVTLVVCLLSAVFALGENEIPNAGDETKILVCYYGSWAVYRPDKGKFDVEQIDPSLCTHLIYAFAGLRGNEITALDPYNDLPEDYGKGAYVRFTNLKKSNKNLKTMLGIGGWNEGSVKYSQMAKTSASRKEFIDSVLAFLPKYGFDGLDVDWEYPANRGGSPDDKENYVLLLKELSEAFVEPGFVLSAAVSAGKPTIDTAYDIPGMSKYLDIINVMCYDYHGSWETVTGANTPMFPRPGETGDYLTFNVNFTMNYWISQGAPPEKLTLGMASYGRGFTLQDPSKHDIGDPAPQPIQAGPYTREPGFWGFNEICEAFQEQSGWTVQTDPYYMTPYAYHDREWISYDDPTSLQIKTEFINQLGLAGGMVWSVDTDDFHGTCLDETFPLIKSMRKGLDTAHGIVTPPPYPPTTTRDPNQPTVAPGGDGNCHASGFFPDPSDCHKYYECVPAGGGAFQKIQYSCGDLAYRADTRSCVPADQVPNCQ